MIRTQISRLADLGVDYIKFDFLSHGSVEGAHSTKDENIPDVWRLTMLIMSFQMRLIRLNVRFLSVFPLRLYSPILWGNAEDAAVMHLVITKTCVMC